ncbi:HNH endonuclease signature motif containing protein [Flavobacterium sp. CSZ]|uniref:HNH endonuclease n=1 Tax=Flavobacterium sp. CSZ TaxID=2783791 RepID=UPI001889E4D1|nr:HNH endonuclease signature motif containing protein [Flavobacterium sp. CSZ]MBF4487749.1 HNH endonuclease [Flavobacterium sp. CSZ]
MNYWVNQGKTYKEEKKGGYLWAPLSDINGKSVFHWETMSELEVNDIVFNYCKGNVFGYSIVMSLPYLTEKPNEFSQDSYWHADGRMVDVEYIDFEKKISLKELYESIKDLLPLKYSPIIGKSVTANQGYLYKISDECALEILKIANVDSRIINEVIDAKNNGTEIINNVPDITSRKGLVNSRVGQGEYRRRLLKRWNNKCAITGCSIKEILIASHIKPWRESDDSERLDVDNGILLSPKYDALFDKNLISFTNEGKIIISKKITSETLGDLKISGQEKIENLTDGNKKYLDHHRKKLECKL